MADEVIVVEPIIQNITVVDSTASINITAPGPQGPAGVFVPSDIFYVHTQAVASAVWTINHNLGGQPVAVVLDSAGTQCEGTFSYPSTNQMIITFTAAFTGVAYVV
jgi:hypothetical protein